MSKALCTPSWLFAILVCTAVVIAWPGGVVQPSAAHKPENTRRAAAVPALANGAIPLQELIGSRNSAQAADDAVEQKLQTDVDVNVRDEKIRDVLQSLSQNGKRFRLVIDDRSLNEAQIFLDDRLTLHWKSLRIEEVLRRLFEPKSVNWFIRNGAVHVTLMETSEAPIVRTYSLEGLESPDASSQLRNRRARTPADRAEQLSQTGNDYDWVLDMIRSHTSDIWAGREGAGESLLLINETLIVSQTFRTQREIDELLRVLRLAAGKKLHGAAFALRHRNDPHGKDRAILHKLAAAATISLKSVPLEEALSQIERKLKDSFRKNRRTLDDAQISFKTKVSLHADGSSWNEALATMLRPAGIAYYVDYGVIQLTTETAEEEQRWDYLFDVRDLLQAASRPDRFES